MEVSMSNKMAVKANKAIKKYTMIFSLDVHTNNIYIYGINHKTGEILEDVNLTGGFSSVLKRLRKHGPPGSVLVIYEAGNMGYAPHRFFSRKGYACDMIAPTSIPRRPKEQKTDRDDALHNLEYYISNLVNTVWVPTEEDESVRDLLRYRLVLVHEAVKVKQRINALVKRKGAEYTLTKSRWGKTHLKWLATLPLLDASRQVLDCLLTDLEQKDAQIQGVMQNLNHIFAGDRYREAYHLYRLLKGIGPINAMTYIIELGDLTRFPQPKRIMNYIGVVPRKRSSGQHDPRLSITKEGNPYARRAVVGTAKQYRDRRLLYSAKQLERFPEPLCSFLTKCQNRLYHMYHHLVKGRHKNAMVARVAVARELCGFLWELMVKVRPQLQISTMLKQAA
jgi:transposase